MHVLSYVSKPHQNLFDLDDQDQVAWGVSDSPLSTTGSAAKQLRVIHNKFVAVHMNQAMGLPSACDLLLSR